ncbi:MAG TPA: MBOAT family O-acyltransferase [Candidatus Binatia bacterium]|nr:MBOAT family O-acyltransferase [Candidatus Binatia bacterium]
MTPYADLTYFLFLLYPLAALAVFGVVGRLGRTVVLVVSMAVVLFQYGDPLRVATSAGEHEQLAFLCAYVAWSVAIVLVLAHAPSRVEQPAFYAAVGLALAPLVAVKTLPLALRLGILHVRAPRAAGPAGVPSGGAGLFDTFGFLGVSYMTLRVVDALIAVHDRVVKRPRVRELLSYLLFAPTISAGPIDRFHRYAKDLHALPRSGREYLVDLEAGVHRIAQGFLYKFIVADLLYRHALEPLARRSDLLGIVAYMYAFSLYLFFDFAGYSAFAIGVGRIFGIRVPENFDKPFLSRNFREMWDRWHISLSWWLRDHVYMRFMLNAARRKWFRGNDRLAHAVALMLTMTLMGCWHGLELQYVVYGAYQGAMLVAYDVVGRWALRRRLFTDGPFTRVAGIVLTVNLFCFGLLIFSGRLFHGPG